MTSGRVRDPPLIVSVSVAVVLISDRTSSRK